MSDLRPYSKAIESEREIIHVRKCCIFVANSLQLSFHFDNKNVLGNTKRPETGILSKANMNCHNISSSS